MKKPFHMLNAFRFIMLTAAGLALYLPAKNLPQGMAEAAQAPTQAQIKLPEGIMLACAQTSWQAVAALSR